MKLRKLIVILLCIALCACLYSPLPAGAAIKPDYKMHVNVGENTAWGQAALMFANKV